MENDTQFRGGDAGGAEAATCSRYRGVLWFSFSRTTGGCSVAAGPKYSLYSFGGILSSISAPAPDPAPRLAPPLRNSEPPLGRPAAERSDGAQVGHTTWGTGRDAWRT